MSEQIPPEGFIVVQKYGAHVTVSPDMFVDVYPYGPPQPRPPDPEFEARKATAAMVIPASIRRLDALDDPVSRVVLDLHRRESSYRSGWSCSGCDIDGYEAEEPAWPCRTVEAIAAVHGIDLTDDWLYHRPTDGSLDLPTPEDS